MSIATSAIERLQDVAGRTGAVTRADERATAAELHVPLAAVHGAATFYDDLAKTRRGSRHVRVCEGTACFVADGGQHVADVERALGVSVGACRQDGLVSLQAVRCIGYCYAAPALLDGTVPHAGPTLADELARGRPDAPPIPVVAITEPVVLAGIVAGDDPWQHWPEVLGSWPPQRLIDELVTSGLRGRGGAEFPVAAKWSAAAAGPVPRYVVGNGDEGDPGSFCDRVLWNRTRTECSLGWRTPRTRLARNADTCTCDPNTRQRCKRCRLPRQKPPRPVTWAQPARQRNALRGGGRGGCRFLRRGRGNRAVPRAGGSAGRGTP